MHGSPDHRRLSLQSAAREDAAGARQPSSTALEPLLQSEHGVASDHSVEQTANKAAVGFISPAAIGAFEGYFCTFAIVVPYVAFYDVPNWEGLVGNAVSESGASRVEVMALYVSLILCSGLHLFGL